MRQILPLLFSCLLAACIGIPENIKPVQGFEVQQYLGTWYEIARLENSFETGLEQISATYSLREDGGVKVLNRGFDTGKQRWQHAEGRAYFIGPTSEGRLKVSFFWPFYGAYNIIDLDQNYQHVLICGADYSYFWFLSRTPNPPETVKQALIAKAKHLGFATEKLIFVKH